MSNDGSSDFPVSTYVDTLVFKYCLLFGGEALVTNLMKVNMVIFTSFSKVGYVLKGGKNYLPKGPEALSLVYTKPGDEDEEEILASIVGDEAEAKVVFMNLRTDEIRVLRFFIPDMRKKHSKNMLAEVFLKMLPCVQTPEKLRTKEEANISKVKF